MPSKNMMIFVCKECGVRFTRPQWRKGIFCSRRCHQKFNAKNVKDWRWPKGRTRPHTKKTKEIMSKKSLAHPRRHWLGKHRSEETKGKLKKSLKKFYKDNVPTEKAHSYLYKKGRAFEYRVIKFFEKQGYFVTRSAGSKFPDLVVLNREEIFFVECKARKSGSSNIETSEKRRAKELVEKFGIPFKVAYKDKKRHIRIRNITSDLLAIK